MKVVIVSDTHRRDGNLTAVLEIEGKIDRLIHLGDVEGSQNFICQVADCEVDIVAGNNDFLSFLPREKEIRLGGRKILLTHGDAYHVSRDTGMLRRTARERGMDIVMFGHTHRPCLEEQDGVIILNPGSLSYPRQEGRKPSYIVMEIKESNQISFEIKYLE